MSLRDLFYPRGVAVVGSVSPGKLGYVLIKQLIDGGFTHIYAVNPKAHGAFSLPGFPSVAAVDAPVDLAVIASPAPTVKNVLEDCGRAGVHAAVIITAGFSEAGNAAGEEELKETARKYGIRFVGPNCAGIVNTHHRLFPTLETNPPRGATALISQSGALGGAILSWAEEQGLGFSKFVSFGNGADLDEIELLRYLQDDPETRIVALYIESVRRGREFMEAAREFTRYKPLVVIKSGRTSAGQRAALSHTGSMAGVDAVYDAALKACGAIRVETVEEMFDLCKGFTCLPPVKGRRVAIVTNSGGPGVMAADKADEAGLEIAEPSPGLKQKLMAFLPDYCAFNNPVDLTVEGTEEGYYRTLVEILGEFDAALAQNVGTPYLDPIPLARGINRAYRETGKPIAANFMAGKTVAASLPLLKEWGIPNFVTGERAVTALARMAAYEAFRTADHPLPPLPDDEKQLPGEGPLLEPEAMAWLKDNGIPIPRFRFAADREAALKACAEIGYPAVMKVVSPQIIHKSDSGGVRLNLTDDATAGAAFDAIAAAAAGKDFRGVVVYPMLKGGREVILGLSRDPQFGPVVVVGLGGIYTEILKDISLRIAPVDLTGAREMLRSLRSFPLLEGSRGREPADLETLAQTLAHLSTLPFRYPEIAEMDLNPVFVFPKGLVVGDVRLIRKNRHH